MITRARPRSIGLALLAVCWALWAAPARPLPPAGPRPQRKQPPTRRAPACPRPPRPSGTVAITVQVIPTTTEARDHTVHTFLAQNSPNWFTSSTIIRYGLATASNLSIVVYSVDGRKVATLATGYRNAGIFSLWWDGRGDDGLRVPAGIYFYRMTTDTRTLSRKMIVLR